MLIDWRKVEERVAVQGMDENINEKLNKNNLKLKKNRSMYIVEKVWIFLIVDKRGLLNYSLIAERWMLNAECFVLFIGDILHFRLVQIPHF